MPSSPAEAAAALLVRAGIDGPLEAFPPDLAPADPAAAYAIQDAVIGAGARIAAWKVAPAKADGEPACSPIPERNVLPPGAILTGPLRAPLVEVEIALRLGADLPGDRAVSRDEAAAAVASAHAAFEILDSRFRDRKAVSRLSAVADAQGNAAVAIGEGMPAWRDLEFAGLALVLEADGEVVAAAAGGPSTAAVLDALAWLAGHAGARGRPLRAGQVVITGARIGALPLPPARRLAARIAGIGEVALDVGLDGSVGKTRG